MFFLSAHLSFFCHILSLSPLPSFYSSSSSSFTDFFFVFFRILFFLHYLFFFVVYCYSSTIFSLFLFLPFLSFLLFFLLCFFPLIHPPFLLVYHTNHHHHPLYQHFSSSYWLSFINPAPSSYSILYFSPSQSSPFTTHSLAFFASSVFAGHADYLAKSSTIFFALLPALIITHILFARFYIYIFIKHHTSIFVSLASKISRLFFYINFMNISRPKP